MQFVVSRRKGRGGGGGEEGGVVKVMHSPIFLVQRAGEGKQDLGGRTGHTSTGGGSDHQQGGA